MNHSILVTGGAGFIGSHLCRRLLQQGEDVLCLDNLFTGQRSNIQDLLSHPHFEFMRKDVAEELRLYMKEIYNLACPASPIHYQFDPVSTVQTSILGAINMLYVARRSKARILQASTSEVYGDPTLHPQPESYWGNVNPIGWRACYDEGKRCAETLFFDHHRQYGVEIKVARIFNTYGPNMHPKDGRVVSNFILQALTNQELTVYGDGSQTRSMCYVDDLVDGLIRLMASPAEFVGPVNLGNPTEMSMLELASKIIELTGSRSLIKHQDLPSDDPRHRQPVIELAKEKLHWQPSTPLESGLKRTIAYFDELLKQGLAA